jgi:hypothetical protein
MKRLIAICLLSLLGACATVPQGPPAPKSFIVHQFEMLNIEYTSPTTVDAVDANGPADKIFDCARAAAAGQSQAPDFTKGHGAYVQTCIAVMFKGPIQHGAVAVQPAAPNADILLWTAEALDYDAFGRFLKGNQPQGPFHSSAECVAQSKMDIKRAYATGKVAKTDSLVIYCVPIPKYGEQADGSSQVDYKPWPGADGNCFWQEDLSAPCEYSISYRL